MHAIAWQVREGAKPPPEKRGMEPARGRGEEVAGERTLRCRSCNAAIAAERDIFSPGAQPPVQVYVNPHGFMHEVITVRAARGLLCDGERSEEFSWFPGYGWRHAYCARCWTHLGWRYDALQPATEPAGFYGLRRSEIVFG